MESTHGEHKYASKLRGESAERSGESADSHQDAKLVSTRARTPPRRAHFTVQRENFRHLNFSTHGRAGCGCAKVGPFWRDHFLFTLKTQRNRKIVKLKRIKNDELEPKLKQEIRSIISLIFKVNSSKHTYKHERAHTHTASAFGQHACEAKGCMEVNEGGGAGGSGGERWPL